MTRPAQAMGGLGALALALAGAAPAAGSDVEPDFLHSCDQISVQNLYQHAEQPKSGPTVVGSNIKNIYFFTGSCHVWLHPDSDHHRGWKDVEIQWIHGEYAPNTGEGFERIVYHPAGKAEGHPKLQVESHFTCPQDPWRTTAACTLVSTSQSPPLPDMNKLSYYFYLGDDTIPNWGMAAGSTYQTLPKSRGARDQVLAKVQAKAVLPPPVVVVPEEPVSHIQELFSVGVYKKRREGFEMETSYDTSTVLIQLLHHEPGKYDEHGSGVYVPMTAPREIELPSGEGPDTERSIAYSPRNLPDGNWKAVARFAGHAETGAGVFWIGDPYEPGLEAPTLEKPAPGEIFDQPPARGLAHHPDFAGVEQSSGPTPVVPKGAPLEAEIMVWGGSDWIWKEEALRFVDAEAGRTFQMPWTQDGKYRVRVRRKASDQGRPGPWSDWVIYYLGEGGKALAKEDETRLLQVVVPQPDGKNEVIDPNVAKGKRSEDVTGEVDPQLAAEKAGDLAHRQVDPELATDKPPGGLAGGERIEAAAAARPPPALLSPRPGQTIQGDVTVRLRPQAGQGQVAIEVQRLQDGRWVDVRGPGLGALSSTGTVKIPRHLFRDSDRMRLRLVTGSVPSGWQENPLADLTVEPSRVDTTVPQPGAGTGRMEPDEATGPPPPGLQPGSEPRLKDESVPRGGGGLRPD